MKTLATLVMCMACVAFCGPALCSSRTLTFDDVPSGTILRSSPLYHETYRVSFGSRFYATDHVGSAWGPPNSGQNVLTLPVEPELGPGYILLGYYMPSSAHEDYATSLGAYFSTQSNAIVRVTAYYTSVNHSSVPVGNVVIGESGQSWNNRYVQITSSDQPFSMLGFEAVNSPNDLSGFCVDDMEITYVPEPSSLAALGFALAGAGFGALRRRKG